MIELVANERLDIIFEGRCTICNARCLRDDFRKGECRILFRDGARALEAELNIQGTTEIGAHGCRGGFGHSKHPACEHFDYDNGCELCNAMPEKGALLVRRTLNAQAEHDKEAQTQETPQKA